MFEILPIDQAIATSCIRTVFAVTGRRNVQVDLVGIPCINRWTDRHGQSFPSTRPNVIERRKE
jgi:hypothetical protein